MKRVKEAFGDVFDRLDFALAPLRELGMARIGLMAFLIFLIVLLLLLPPRRPAKAQPKAPDVYFQDASSKLCFAGWDVGTDRQAYATVDCAAVP